jgi:CRP-like cAMP-binding protein
MQPSTVVALGAHFRCAARRWPSLAENLVARALAQADRLAEHAAILQLTRVDLRLLAVLWHLAERFGRVTPGGVVVPLELTHAQLGRLVGAQRSTVSLAVARLDEEGLVRRGDSGWVLVPESRRSLDPAPERAALPAG